MGKKLELKGKRFGRLVVLEEAGKNKYGSTMWLCKCDCGNRCSVVVGNLTSSGTTSCGCGRATNLEGKRFGKLVVLARNGTDKRGKVLWLCKCDCGNEKIIAGCYLTKGDTKSCGCKSIGNNLRGKRFGRLIALKDVGRSKDGTIMWLCKCDCGNEKSIRSSSLTNNRTKSCGCLRDELASRKGKDNPNFGKPMSDETKQNLSKINTGRNNPNFGRTGKKSSMWKGGVTELGIPLYDTYVSQFPTNFEKTKLIIKNGAKALGVRCHNSSCKKWFVPKTNTVQNRLKIFNGKKSGGSNFYCSPECKKTCSTYNRALWPDGQNPNKQELPYTEPEYKLYRKTVMERENYICEYCGEKATDVHHEQPKKEQPMLALDPDYGHACCKKCHYKYGHKKGTECSTGALARKKCPERPIIKE